MEPQVKLLLREAWKDVMSDRWQGFVFYFTNLRLLYSAQLAPLIAAAIVDSAARGTIAHNWLKLALLLALGEVFASVLGFYGRKVSNDMLERIQVIRFARYAEQAFGIDYHALVNTSRGAIVSKARSKADFIAPFTMLSNDAVRIAVSLVVSFFVLYHRYPPLAFAYLGIWVPLCIVFNKVASTRVVINKDANEAWDAFFGDYSDAITNVDTIKQFATEKTETKRLLEVGKKQYAIFTRRWRAGARQQNVFSIFDTSLNIAFGLFGLYALAHGKITIGTYVLVAAYIRNTMNDANSVSNFIRNFNEESVRGISLDAYDQEIHSAPNTKLDKVPKAMAITFQSASFSYKDGKQDVLRNFNLTIEKGQKIGIVGRSGSGKTTITKLLLGLYPLSSGEIIFDDASASALGAEQIRKLIAYVPQEPALFHRSVRENIVYGNSNASVHEVGKALKQAYVSEFTDHLPLGLETLVGDRGIKLSGGQKQRVAIARAILKNAPILLFDEATSALDSESEAVIQKAMNNIMKDKTTIVVAHRLSTLRHMDRIIVMDEGRVVEDGTHAELIEQNRFYAGFWKHQSGGFIED